VEKAIDDKTKTMMNLMMLEKMQILLLLLLPLPLL